MKKTIEKNVSKGFFRTVLWGLILAVVPAALLGCSHSASSNSDNGTSHDAVSGNTSLMNSQPGGAHTADSSLGNKVAMARGRIDVQGGLIHLGVEGSGVVTQLPVTEGASVQKGALLLAQNDAVANSNIEVAEARLALAKQQQATAAHRLTQLRAKSSRLEAAASQGAIDDSVADDAQQQYLNAQADAQQASGSLSVAQSELNAAKAQNAQLALRAPVGGTIVRVATQQGAYLEAGATAMTLLPARPLIVRAELSAAFVNTVKPGMKASIVSDMDGAISQDTLPNAHVVNVSPVYVNATLQDSSQVGTAQVVDCILAFDSPAHARVGQNVMVTFYD
ncbi:hypothetical protein LMG33818_001795 [Halomonadaceae bacterium LMG 33818]